MDPLQSQREQVNKKLRELRASIDSELLFVGLLVHAAGIARALIRADSKNKARIVSLYADSCVDATTPDNSKDQPLPILIDEDPEGKMH